MDPEESSQDSANDECLPSESIDVPRVTARDSLERVMVESLALAAIFSVMLYVQLRRRPEVAAKYRITPNGFVVIMLVAFGATLWFIYIH